MTRCAILRSGICPSRMCAIHRINNIGMICACIFVQTICWKYCQFLIVILQLSAGIVCCVQT